MRETLAGIAAVALVLIGIGLAFTVTGSPGHQRALALDEQRVRDLDAIAGFLTNRGYQRSLPGRLPGDIARTDPVTKRAYEYQRVGPHSYRLCATFDLPAPRDEDTSPYFGSPYDAARVSRHGAGRRCFVINSGE